MKEQKLTSLFYAEDLDKGRKLLAYKEMEYVRDEGKKFLRKFADSIPPGSEAEKKFHYLLKHRTPENS